jgi:hypothetical protein
VAAVVLYFQMNYVFPSWIRGFDSPLPLHKVNSLRFVAWTTARQIFIAVGLRGVSLRVA